MKVWQIRSGQVLKIRDYSTSNSKLTQHRRRYVASKRKVDGVEFDHKNDDYLQEEKDQANAGRKDPREFDVVTKNATNY
jgi:hypothetical protein